MRTLLKYDCFEDDEFEGEYISDYLDDIAEKIFSKHDTLVIQGNIGRWDGPQPVTFFLHYPKDFKRFISSQDSFEICFADNDETISELQRYSEQWSFDADQGALIVKQWHHDGCNIFSIFPKNKKGTCGAFTLEEVTV